MRTIFFALLLTASLHAADVAPSALQKKLIGHWRSEADIRHNTYYALSRRMVDRDIANSDAAFSMMDYKVWDEWPELRTILIEVDEPGANLTMIVITFSEDWQSAVCREKALMVWSKSFKIKRVDDLVRPAKIPQRLIVNDLESGVGQ